MIYQKSSFVSQGGDLKNPESFQLYIVHFLEIFAWKFFEKAE